MLKGRFTTRRTCRLCNSSMLHLFLNMGLMPLAGDFLKKKDIGKEKLYPLRIFFCENCFLVQLLDIVKDSNIFKDYRYFSSVSLSRHFGDYAQEISTKFLKKGSFVVEIGSNDGVLLGPFKKRGYRVLGVDPAKNATKEANKKGLKTITDYFGIKSSKRILEEYGQADAIFANNVLAHIDNMEDVAKGIEILLKDDGIFVFEVHYLGNLIKDLQYDFFYPGEHLTYYSLYPLMLFWKKYGIKIFDIKKTKIHSGSIRVYASKKSRKKSNIEKFLNEEKKLGLYKKNTFDKFATQVFKNKSLLEKNIKDLAKKGKIVGYGAAGRANTLLNYSNITDRAITYIVDESSQRQGRFTPGNHIEIFPVSKFKNDNPKFCMILAWSYADEIMKKEKEFKENGGKFVVPLPKFVVK